MSLYKEEGHNKRFTSVVSLNSGNPTTLIPLVPFENVHVGNDDDFPIALCK